MYRLWQFDDLGGMLYGTILNSTILLQCILFMCFLIDDFTLFCMPVFLSSWSPPCAPGTCAAVPITWPEFAKKTSRSFFIPVMLLHLSGYSVLHFLINFCHFCPTSQSSLPDVTTSSHHHITTSPHHHMEPHGAAQFNKSLRNKSDHLQFVQGNSIPEAVRNMVPIKIDIPPSPQGKSSGAHQTSSILCQVIVTDRKSFPTHLR